MSQTSRLAHHPFGAAVARSPDPASGGGGEGVVHPLVSLSERGVVAGVGSRVMQSRARRGVATQRGARSDERSHAHAARLNDREMARPIVACGDQICETLAHITGWRHRHAEEYDTAGVWQR